MQNIIINLNNLNNSIISAMNAIVSSTTTIGASSTSIASSIGASSTTIATSSTVISAAVASKIPLLMILPSTIIGGITWTTILLSFITLILIWIGIITTLLFRRMNSKNFKNFYKKGNDAFDSNGYFRVLSKNEQNQQNKIPSSQKDWSEN